MSLFVAMELVADVFRNRVVSSIAKVIDFGGSRRIVVSTGSETASCVGLLVSIAGCRSRVVVDVRRLLGRNKRVVVHLRCVGRSLWSVLMHWRWRRRVLMILLSLLTVVRGLSRIAL